TGQLEHASDELGDRIDVLRVAMQKRVGQLLRLGIAGPVRELGLLHARCTRADEYADAAAAMARAQPRDGGQEPVLLQSEQRKAVVAAIPLCPLLRQRRVEVRDL